MNFPEVRTVPVADIEIPAELSRLYDLAYNLWWTWQPRAYLLFSTIDPVRWIHDHNPVELLINLEPHRWEVLLQDESFMASYHALVREFDRYMEDREQTWFHRRFPGYDGGPVAYFSTEYGWHESLGVYSGGLGILSGDHSKAASDLGLPFVGLGLMYRRGYFRQTIDVDGHQQHHYPHYDLRRLPVLPVTYPNGRQVRVAVEFQDRKVHLRPWKAMVGRVPVLLLDSDLRENDAADRPITSILYVRGREMRLCQELVLGVGGVLTLRALGIQPAVWHMNEGHSAFLSIQRVRDLIERNGGDLETTIREISRSAVFTTHTPVPAGNEVFETSLVRKYLETHAEKLKLPVDGLLALGRTRAEEEDGTFNLTALAIRTSRTSNGVSVKHAEVAAAMWRHLWPAELGETPVVHITNGVHVPTWIGPEMAGLLREHVDRNFEDNLLDPGFGPAVEEIPDEELWTAHLAQKRRLLYFVRQRLRAQFARHGRSPDQLRLVDRVLDADALTLGFARRFTTYKRAALIFRDLERLRGILREVERPVQIVFAGKAHPADRPGQDLIRRIFQESVAPETRGSIVFVEDYDMRIARHLVQGVDVWLNTPRRPQEASGTSGMKAAINGGLNCSVLDGWWIEGYDPAYGWAIGAAKDYDDSEAQDVEDAESLYRVLSEQIVPCFYDRESVGGLPIRWIGRMKRSMAALTPRFSAARLIRDYVEKSYSPAGLCEKPGAEPKQDTDT